MNAVATREMLPTSEGGMDFVSHYVNQYERVRSTRSSHDAAWLHELRERAIRRTQEIGIPQARDEAWKYTPLPALTKRLYPVAMRGSDNVAANFATPDDTVNALLAGLQAAHKTLLVNGTLIAQDSVNPGVTISSLTEHPTEPAMSVQKVLLTSTTGSYFDALNLAACVDIVVIRVAASVHAAVPLHLHIVATQPLAQFPRLIVHLEPNAQLTLVESYCGGVAGIDYFTNCVMDIRLESGAVLKHTRVQLEHGNATHLAIQRVHVAERASYQANALTSGSILSRCEQTVSLEGELADARLNGLFIGSGRQHQEQHVHVKHEQPATRSEQLFHGVLDGRAHGVFRGSVHVDANAQKVDARQINRNLLLSDYAEATTQPQLQILADDVKCSHGATVGQLDDNALFYLRSRGLSAAIARGLLTQAFSREVLESVEAPAIRDALMKVVASYWGQAEQSL